MKHFLQSISLVGLFAIIVSVGFGQTAESEPNNTPFNANLVAVDGGDYTGSLNAITDPEDFWKIPGGTSGQVDISVVWGTGTNVEWAVESFDAGTTNNFSTITGSPSTFTANPARDYYVKMRMHTTGADTYTLTLSGPALPVQMTSFAATSVVGGVRLSWSTATETDNAGFDVERRAIDDLRLTIDEYQKVGFVAGAGTSTSAREYSFTDAPAPGRYAYRLKQIDRSGSFTYAMEAEVLVAAPTSVTLAQNHPNPFNPSTTIRYELPEAGAVRLEVFDALGRSVASLVDGVMQAGVHTASFDGLHLPSGTYLARLSAGGQVRIMKMQMVK